MSESDGWMGGREGSVEGKDGSVGGWKLCVDGCVGG